MKAFRRSIPPVSTYVIIFTQGYQVGSGHWSILQLFLSDAVIIGALAIFGVVAAFIRSARREPAAHVVTKAAPPEVVITPTFEQVHRPTIRPNPNYPYRRRNDRG